MRGCPVGAAAACSRAARFTTEGTRSAGRDSGALSIHPSASSRRTRSSSAPWRSWPRPRASSSSEASSGGSSPSTFLATPWNGQLARWLRLVEDSGPSRLPPRRIASTSTSSGSSRPPAEPAGGIEARRRPGAAPTPSGPAAGRSASHTRVAEGRQRRQRHRIDGAGSQIRRHRRLERQANLRPAARRRILQPRHHVRGEVSLRLPGDAEQPLGDVGRCTSCGAAPGEDGPVTRGEDAPQPPAVQRLCHRGAQVRRPDQDRQPGATEDTVHRRPLVVAEQPWLRAAREDLRIQSGHAHEREAATGERLQRQDVDASRYPRRTLHRQLGSGLGQPPRKATPVDLRAPVPGHLPPHADVADEGAPGLHCRRLARCRPAGAVPLVEGLRLECAPEAGGLEPRPPGLEVHCHRRTGRGRAGRRAEGRHRSLEPVHGRRRPAVPLAERAGPGLPVASAYASVPVSAPSTASRTPARWSSTAASEGEGVELGEEALAEEPGHQIDRLLQRREARPGETDLPGKRAGQWDGRPSPGGQAGVGEGPEQLRRVLGSHHCQGTVGRRCARRQRLAQGVDQRRCLPARGGSDDAGEGLGRWTRSDESACRATASGFSSSSGAARARAAPGPPSSAWKSGSSAASSGPSPASGVRTTTRRPAAERGADQHRDEADHRGRQRWMEGEVEAPRMAPVPQASSGRAPRRRTSGRGRQLCSGGLDGTQPGLRQPGEDAQSPARRSEPLARLAQRAGRDVAQDQRLEEPSRARRNAGDRARSPKGPGPARSMAGRRRPCSAAPVMRRRPVRGRSDPAAPPASTPRQPGRCPLAGAPRRSRGPATWGSATLRLPDDTVRRAAARVRGASVPASGTPRTAAGKRAADTVQPPCKGDAEDRRGKSARRIPSQ